MSHVPREFSIVSGHDWNFMLVSFPSFPSTKTTTCLTSFPSSLPALKFGFITSAVLLIKITMHPLHRWLKFRWGFFIVSTGSQNSGEGYPLSPLEIKTCMSYRWRLLLPLHQSCQVLRAKSYWLMVWANSGDTNTFHNICCHIIATPKEFSMVTGLQRGNKTILTPRHIEDDFSLIASF